MTGQIHLTPEAERQLHDLDEWLVERADAQVARQEVEALLDYIDGIPTFPLAGQVRDDVLQQDVVGYTDVISVYSDSCSWFDSCEGSRRKREPGGNPGLPRSGEWERTASSSTGPSGLGSDAQ